MSKIINNTIDAYSLFLEDEITINDLNHLIKNNLISESLLLELDNTMLEEGLFSNMFNSNKIVDHSSSFSKKVDKIASHVYGKHAKGNENYLKTRSLRDSLFPLDKSIERREDIKDHEDKVKFDHNDYKEILNSEKQISKAYNDFKGHKKHLDKIHKISKTYIDDYKKAILNYKKYPNSRNLEKLRYMKDHDSYIANDEIHNHRYFSR